MRGKLKGDVMRNRVTTITMTRKLVKVGGSVTIAIPPEMRRILGWKQGHEIRMYGDEKMLVLVREKFFKTTWKGNDKCKSE